MQAINYQVEKWQRQDWRKVSRHYSSELCQNLFGEWVVLRRWGRVSTHQGQSLEQACDSYEEGLAMMSLIEKRRSQRGYEVA